MTNCTVFIRIGVSKSLLMLRIFIIIVTSAPDQSANSQVTSAEVDSPATGVFVYN